MPSSTEVDAGDVDAPAEGWHATPTEELLRALESDREGLDSATAADRLDSAGPNEIAEARDRSPLWLLVGQFTGPLVLVLFGAAGLSVLAGHAVDAVLIAVIVVANGVFGFVQEYRAERSLEALDELATPTAVVRRDGRETTVPATDLVPGDVIVLRQGDVVPADARVLSAAALETDEAPLTGESLPVAKSAGEVAADAPLAERSNVLYRGTSVTLGGGEAVVVATGMDTEVGEIAAGLAAAEGPPTPLQVDLATLGRRLGVAVVLLAAAVVGLLATRGTPLVDAALAAVSLGVAAIPEGLPAIVTVTLALGVRRMARENALVRSLPAVEALGAVDVVCTDKTGTLTEGEMRVTALWVPDAELAPGADTADGRLDALLEIGAVCNDAPLDGDHGDPTERALVEAAREHGIDVAARRAERPRLGEIPFSADRKRMTTVHEDVLYVKGAPAVLLDRATYLRTADGVVSLDDDARELVHERIDAFADRALRVLAFAYRERSVADGPAENGEAEVDADALESDLVFVGLQGLLDPPRPEVRDAIAETRRAGIDVKMITGDNRVTAQAVAAQVGIDDAVLTGEEVDALDDEALRERVGAVDVFARIVPRQKLEILRALQDTGHRVAMTGDGVNDAPALKGADVGIAMGLRGTEVAKRASDIVLLDDDYGTIRTAVRRGRTVFDNVWKFVAYLLSANAAEVALVFVASLYGYLILPAVQLLWINLLTDGLPALALGTDPTADDVMDRPPRRGGVIDRGMAVLVGGFGGVTTLAMLGLTWWSLDGAPSATRYATTMVFTGFVVAELLKLYAVRWVRGTPPGSNRWLVAAVAASFGMQLAVLYTPLAAYFGAVPLSLADWGVLAAVAAGSLVAYALVGVAVAPRIREGGG